jgi:hypothetical protein
MAHYLAGLIDAARRTKSSAERRVAEARAAKTVVSLWEHRASLPGRAYPLARFRNVISILESWRPGASQFAPTRLSSERQRLAAEVTQYVERLMIALLLMEAPTQSPRPRTSQTVAQALSRDERKLLNILEALEEEAVTGSEAEVQDGERGNGGSAHANTVANIAARCCDRAIVALNTLRKQLDFDSVQKA